MTLGKLVCLLVLGAAACSSAAPAPAANSNDNHMFVFPDPGTRVVHNSHVFAGDVASLTNAPRVPRVETAKRKFEDHELEKAIADPISTPNCERHKSENECVVDVSCGWCLLAKRGVCVEGDFKGPTNKSLPCPVYITDQIYLPPDDGSVDDLFTDPGSKAQGTSSDVDFNDADTLEALRPQTADPSQEGAEPEGEDGNDDAAAETGAPAASQATEAEESDGVQRAPNGIPIPRVDVRSDWGVTSGAHGDSTAKRQVAQTPIPDAATAAKFTPLTEYDETHSPCGLPGVPDFVCEAWKKMYCGPDKLTDEALMQQSTANSAIAWCATEFENNPEVYAPEAKPFPWFINGQEVPHPGLN